MNIRARVPLRLGLHCLVLSFACGCSTLPSAQRASLQQACDCYDKGDIAAATRQIEPIIQQYPDADEIAEAYYLRGLCRMKGEQLADAAADFELAAARSKREDLTARSQVSLAAVAYRQGDWTRAAELYETALQKLPAEPPADEAAFAAGVAMQRAGRWKDAALQFGRVIRSFPNSRVAADAKRLVAWPHEYFTIQLAVYAEAHAATAAVESYKTKGIDAYVESMTHGQCIVWVVMAGRYTNYNQATAALPSLRLAVADAAIIP